MNRQRLGFAWRFLVASFLLAAPSLTACSSDDDGISSSEFASRYCALFKPCCAAAGFPDTGQQSCKFFFGAAPIRDKGAAEQCLREYEAQATQPGFCDLTSGTRPESCERAFPDSGQSGGGSKKPGEACTWGANDDCAGDATCDTVGGADTGKCAAFVIVGDGAACIGVRSGNGSSWSGDAVNDQIALCDGDADFYCSNSNVCKKKSAVGQPCDGYEGCFDDGYCSSGQCVAKLATGSPCPNFSDRCNDAAYCSDTTQQCEPRAADGQSCSTGDECLSNHCDSSTKTCKKTTGIEGLVLGLVCG
ncbi:MAG: hypothetical protein R3B13_15180 [Polyangiaceae bacterium]